MALKAPALHLVLCRDDIRCHLGAKQAEWAERERLIEFRHEAPVPEGGDTIIRVYHSDRDAWDLNEAIGANLYLRECDICGKPGPWEYPMRPFKPDLASLASAEMGGPRRPLQCCFMCGQWIQRRDRRALRSALERRAVRDVAKLNGFDPDRARLTPNARAAFLPQINQFVGQVLANTHGRPTRRR